MALGRAGPGRMEPVAGCTLPCYIRKVLSGLGHPI